MKKVLAAVLAIICVAGSMNCLPQNTDYSGSTSVITADAAEKTEEVTILAGKNAEKYKYTMADEQLYTTSLKETKLNWVDANNGNTYAAYTLTITDNTDKAKLVDTYVIGLKSLKSTNLDVKMSDKVDYCSDIEKALSDTKNFKEGDPAIEAIKALFDSKTHQATVKYIADNACKESYLKTIDLSGIEYIGAGAFDGCRYITDITIPATVKYVGKGAFQNSGIKKLSVLNEMINIPDSFCSSTNLTDVTFAHPDYIRSIGVSAFASTPLSTPIFSTWGEAKGYEDLRICDKAFQNCTSIKNCEFSDNVTVAGKNSFDGCSSLLTLKVGKNTYGLDQYAFQNCTSLNSITFNDKLIGLGGGCFQGCTALKSVSGIPGTLEDWVDIDSSGGIGMGEGVFASCTSLIDVVLPTSITRIPPKTFSGCTKLTTIKYGLPGAAATESADTIKVIGDEAFNNCLALPKAEYNNVTKIGTKAFAGSGIKSASFPAATNISCTAATTEEKSDDSKGSSAFEGCTKLESVSIPKSQFIRKTSFKGCTALTEFKAGKCKLVEDNAMEGCSAIVDITLLSDQYGGDLTANNDPNKTNSSHGYVFKDCTSAKKITIAGEDKVKLSAGLFSGCTALESVGGDISSVSVIGKECFNGCTNLKKLNLPALRIIEDSGFMNCTALKSISDSGVAINAEDYGKKCFMNCSALSIDVEGIISTIGESAFQNSGVTNVSIDGMVGGTVVIGSNAFADCANLKNATILSPGAYKFNVGSQVFKNCPVLEKAVYEGPIITKSMFQSCPLLKEVGTTADIFYESAFADCTSLVSVKDKETGYPVIAKEIDGGVFKNCAALTNSSSNLDTVFKGIGQYVGCTSLEAATVSTLTKGMFQNCSSLNDVVIADSVVEVPELAFQNCTSLSDFDFSNIQNINSKAFDNSGFVNLELSGVKVGTNAFSNCQNLKTVKLKAETLSSSAFANCPVLKTVDVDVPVIGSSVFSGCAALETATIKTGEIGKTVFKGDSALNNVTINPNNEYTLGVIYDQAFGDCAELKSLTVLGNPVMKYKAVGFLGSNVNSNFTLMGNAGSTVQEYANTNKVKFKAVGSNIEPTTGEEVPSTEAPTSGTDLKKGDANGDGSVDMSDVVMVMQACLNPKKYGTSGTSEDRITADGEKAGDVDGKTGLTANDALIIQRYSLKLIDTL